jgi:O-antigen/teichoic acid export membrane protein
MFIGTFYIKLLLFLVFSFYAHSLGPEQIGIWGIVISYMLIISSLDFKFDSSMLRYIPEFLGKDKTKIKDITSSVFSWLVVTTVPLLVIFVILSYFLSFFLYENTHLFLLFLLSFTAFIFDRINNFFNSLLRALKREDKIQINLVVTQTVLVVSAFSMIFFLGMDITAILLATVAASFLSLLILSHFTRHLEGVGLFLRKDFMFWVKDIFKKNEFWVHGTIISLSILLWGGTLILSFFYSSSDVGVFNSFLRISQYILIIPYVILIQTTAPISHSYHTGNKQKAKQITMKSFNAIAPLMISFLFLSLFFGKDFIMFYLGEAFVKYVFALNILIAGIVVHGSFHLFNNILFVDKEIKYSFLSHTIAALFFILFSVVFVRNGVLILAVINFISLCILEFGIFLKAYKILDIHIQDFNFRPIILPIAVSLVFYFIFPNKILLLITYLICFVVFLDKKMKDFIIDILNSLKEKGGLFKF